MNFSFHIQIFFRYTYIFAVAFCEGNWNALLNAEHKKAEALMKGRSTRRSWSEIVADILAATSTPSGKTKIMHKSRMNFRHFNSYFYDLLRKGFIEEMNGSDRQMVYKTTERGKTMLGVLRKAKELFSSEEQ